ncbi:MAG: hypothetical protein KAG97_02285 [Victivallales bacterium]|nr:hypothetical protein [Victivallales bacterium]
MEKLKQKTGILLLTFLAVYSLFVGAEDFGPSWITMMNDDGHPDNGWVMLSNPSAVLRKKIILDMDPTPLSKVVLEYLISTNPYDPRTKSYIINPENSGIKWANLIVCVNGTPIVDQSAGPFISKGAHYLPVPVFLLKKGENIIDFKWKKAPPGNPGDWRYGYIYFAVDAVCGETCDSSISTDSGRTFIPDPRTKGKREYIVRLRLKFN